MGALLRQLLGVCLLRSGPQDLPYSPALMRATLAALLALQAAIGLATGSAGSTILVRLGVTLLLLAGVTPWLLGLRGLHNRTAQTLLAQAGAGLLFSMAMLPAAFALLPYLATGDGTATGAGAAPPQAMLPALAMLVLFLWKLRVDASIWSHALDVRRQQGLLLAVVLVVTEIFLLVLFAPTVPRPAGT